MNTDDNKLQTDFPLNHDLHVHSMLSSCSSDPDQRADNIVRYAEEHGFSALCITDHFWDENVPGASDWYAPQNFAHISESKQYLKSDKVRVMFGCETEYCGGDRIAISKERCKEFDFIVIPPNHYHMGELTCPPELDAHERAKLFTDRLNELTALDLPWRKVGIAHFTCKLIYRHNDYAEVFRSLDEGELRRALSFFAEHGTGIELNEHCFDNEWTLSEEGLRIYALAKEEGCRFYRGSDGHHPDALPGAEGLKLAIKKLGITKDLLYTVP